MLSTRVTAGLLKCPIILKRAQALRCMSAVNIPLDGVTEPVVVGEGIKAAVTTLPEHSVYNVIGHYQSLLDTIQVTSGVPWWVVLIGTGVVLRSSLLILNVGYEKRFIKNAPHVGTITKLQVELRQKSSKGDTIGALTKVEEIKHYKTKNKFSWRNSAYWFMLPNAAAMCLNFVSIRGLAEMPYQPLIDSSFLWLPNLCQADPYYLFPAINAAAVVFVMKHGIDSGENNIFKEMLSSNKFLFGFMAVMGAIQSMFPSALVVYWFASNAIGITLIGPMLRNDGFRKAVGLLTMEEKREALKGMPTIESLKADINEGYTEAREASYLEDMERRKQKLATLEDSDENEGKVKEMSDTLEDDTYDNEAKVKEMSDTIDELKLEIKRKDEELMKSRKKISDELEDLKNCAEFKKQETQQSTVEQIRVQEK